MPPTRPSVTGAAIRRILTTSIGSTVGPHPYPDMVARLQSVISEEIKKQLMEHEGRDYPDYLMACIGGGSNAAGTIYHYLDDERVKIVLAEAGGKGVETGLSAATIQLGKLGIIHGSKTLVMQDEDGQILDLTPFLPVWTIPESVPCMPIWLPATVPLYWQSTRRSPARRLRTDPAGRNHSGPGISPCTRCTRKDPFPPG